MAKEIERKYLVNEPEWRKLISKVPHTSYGITQGYMFDIGNHIGRIRHTSYGAFIFTYKGPTKGIERVEHEFNLWKWVGKLALKLCSKKLVKTRTLIGPWEVDEFHNLNQSLILAEIELKNSSASFTEPKWLGKEVSYDSQYFNSNLIKKVV